MKTGKLYIVATPIGNLGDMTPRAVEVLRRVDYAYSEDTRVTGRLFKHFDITTPLRRFDDQTGERKIPELLELLQAGSDLALTSDAGTPVISDPGMPLVTAAQDAGIEVIAVPGACAAIAALSISGLPAHAHYFGGFLPRKAGKQQALLESLDAVDATLIFYESPHRVASTLSHLARLYPDRQAAVARELTKQHEELLRGSLSHLADDFAARAASEDPQHAATLKGEFVILVAPLVARSTKRVKVDKYQHKKDLAATATEMAKAAQEQS